MREYVLDQTDKSVRASRITLVNAIAGLKHMG
jgi:hypothetical protein